MMRINSASDIGTTIIGNGPLSDLWAAGLEDLAISVIREMDHPLYGEDWEEWIAEHADEIREEAARRGGGQSSRINLAGLVEDGHLDLAAAFEDADWDQVDHAVDYVLRRFGPDNEPGTIEIYLQSAEVYGIRAYRWEEVEGDHSVPFLSLAEALVAAQAYAADCDESNEE